MKNILTLLLIVLTGVSFGQDETHDDSKFGLYVATGLSMSNTYDNTFAYSSYPSVEVGVMKNNWALGIVGGRGNLEFGNTDPISNYWYELKTAIYFPLGNFDGYALMGVGNYMSTSRLFIEYGAGFAYAFNKFGVFTQVSNWDGAWYLTPGISYSF